MGFEPQQQWSTLESVNVFAERMALGIEEVKAALTKAKDEYTMYYNRRCEELHEGVFLGQAPDEPNVLHGQVEECARVVGEPRNKASVKFDEADERLHLLFI
jgi:hypothetical protein